MKKFLHYFKKYRFAALLAPFFKLLEACMDLCVPLIVSNIIDKGINTGDSSYIIKMVCILVAVGFVGLGFSILGQFFAAKSAVGVVSEMKVDLFKKTQELSFSEVDTLGTSSLITRMTSDMNTIQSGINLTLRLFLRSPFVVFGAAIMASLISPVSSIVFWIAIPVLSIFIFGIMLITIPLYKKVQGRLDKVLNSTKENLTGVRVIRAFGNEEEETRKFHSQADELESHQVKVGNISSLMNPLTYALINVAIVTLIYVSGLQVKSGNLTQGEVIALYNYMSQILVELIKLANLIVSITKAIASQKRVQTILDMKSSLKVDSSLEGNNEAYIYFDHVSMRYAGSKVDAISNIDFKVNKGDKIGVIGGTGSGKSTLVNLLPHFYDVSDGNLYIDGKNVQAYDLKDIRNKVGIVLQKACLFKGTIKDNLLWGKQDANENDFSDALRIAQANDVVAKKDKGLDSDVEQAGKNFSGGQKQRLSIARAVIKKPDILIFDDSASALDYATDARLRKEIKGLTDCTVFIVSQRTSSLQDCDKIVVLDDGKMVGFDNHDNLLKNNKVYQDIYYSQFKKEGK